MGGNMYAIDVLKEAAKMAGVPTTHIGKELGSDSAYVAKIANRGSVPRCDTMARMLDVCGYSLCAIPTDKIPNDAIVIDGDANAD